MKRAIKSILKLILSACISIAILSLFCYIYNYSGVHVNNPNGSTDYKWESNQFFSTMKEGFSWFSFDKNGYNNADNSDTSVDILLMGSSHMEAAQVDKNANVGSLLNQKLDGLRTYNIGVSGHTIYTCVSNMSSAYQTYKPSSYVILETSSISLSQDSMQDVIQNTYPEIESHDSGLIYQVQKTIPFAKSFYKAISEWKSISPIPLFEKPTAAATELIAPTESYKTCLFEFLSYARKSVPDSCSVIIFFHPFVYIDKDGNSTTITDIEHEYLDVFSKLCSENDIIFVDVSSAFEEHYKSTNELPNGFINTAVGSGHLNKTGHSIIADCLCDVIGKNKEGK